MATANKTKSDAAFDFTTLEATIIRACHAAFEDVARTHPKETICAFALYSDEDAMTVCPSFDLASRRDARLAKKAENVDDVDCYTFETAEWALEAFGAREAFKDICTTVRTHVMQLDDAGAASFKAQLFETCIRTLERLRAEGAFDAYPGLLLRFTVSDTDVEAEDEVALMERLNGASPYVEQYRRWMERWADD